MCEKNLQIAFEFIEFASTPPTSLPTKESKDPFQLVTQTLCDKILNSPFHDSFLNLHLESSLPSTSDGSNFDARLTYSEVLRFVLSIFCEQAADNSLSTEDWAVLSSHQLGAIIRTFELLVAMSILPSIDDGIGVPLEKRVSFVKVWKPFTDISQRLEQLQKTLQIFQRLCDFNENLKIQLISKFLPDFISANEQIIYFNDFTSEKQYQSFLNQIPLSVVMKELLLLNGGFGLSGRKVMAPAWFLTSLNKKLSEGLASPKGLSHLLVCFNELGGESFWNNSVILSSVANLLSTKPQCAESYQKYALSMFSQFLDIMKNSNFGTNVALLFVLTVDKLYVKAPFVVEVQLIDKLIRPWEILVERGVQNPLTNENGFWNANLDSSIIILKSWLNALPHQYNINSFTFSHRFSKLVPLFMHFCGQAAENEVLDEFKEHLSLILTRLLGEDIKEHTVLMKQMLSDGVKTHGYFKISPQKNLAISEVNESAVLLKYPVNLEILEEPMDEDTLLDFKLEALRSLVKNLSPDLAIKSLVVLMADCLNVWVNKEDLDIYEEDNIRFVPALEQLVAENSQTQRLSAVYILGSVVEILASLEALEFSTDILLDMVNIAITIFQTSIKRLSSVTDVKILSNENNELKDAEAHTTSLAVGLVSAIVTNGMNEESLKHRLQMVGNEMNKFCTVFKRLEANAFADIYRPAYENCKQLLELFSNELKWKLFDSDEISKRTLLTSRKSTHNVTQLEKWRLLLESDDEEAVKGGVLIQIAQRLKLQDRQAFSYQSDFEWVWKTAFEFSSHHDSYVFLSSINALAELSYWQTESFLPRLIESFTNLDENNISKDVSIMWRGKLGEAIAKVFKQLGNYSVFYFDQFSNSLLQLTKTGDELIRSSALNSFSDLVVACRGRKYDAIIHELLFLVSQYLKTEESALVRRSAVHLLRSLLTSAEDSLLSTFADTLRDTHRLLKRLWLNDQDDIVRFHAELALIDLKAIMQRLFVNI